MCDNVFHPHCSHRISGKPWRSGKGDGREANARFFPECRILDRISSEIESSRLSARGGGHTPRAATRARRGRRTARRRWRPAGAARATPPGAAAVRGPALPRRATPRALTETPSASARLPARPRARAATSGGPRSARGALQGQRANRARRRRRRRRRRRAGQGAAAGSRSSGGAARACARRRSGSGARRPRASQPPAPGRLQAPDEKNINKSIIHR